MSFLAWCLRLLSPETAHNLAILGLRFRMLPKQSPLAMKFSVDMRMTVPGLGVLPHPIGLAAGFDKNAVALRGLADLGFSFMEFGTVTPVGQTGNARPRMFRDAGQRSLTNRMGFDNHGADRIAHRLTGITGRVDGTLVGLNAGVNKRTAIADAVWDYIHVLRRFRGLTAFQVVNISSPNTKGLRSLANPEFLQQFAAVLSSELNGPGHVWIKLDPDMAKLEFQQLVQAILANGFAGLVLTNTHRVEKPEVGGQSGHPLLIAATQCLEWAWEVHRGRLPMIGSGGILSGSDILQKVIRGACAVEIYTAMVYRGPEVVSLLIKEVEQELLLRGFTSLEDAWGTYYQGIPARLAPSTTKVFQDDIGNHAPHSRQPSWLN